MSTCSILAANETMAGTAPPATAWLVIEQPGPWGPQALTESRLDPELGAFLGTLTDEYGIRVLLARHPDRPDTGSHVVWLARVTANETLLRRVELDDLSALRDWDYAAMAIGYLPEVGEIDTHPLLLVCAHGRRDACCAVHGRSLLAALLDASSPEQRSRVWECSHIGGHRFAPVTLALPSGAVHGRITPDEAPEFLRRAMSGQILASRFRGRTCYPAPFQAAGAYVREANGLDDAADLHVLRVAAGKAVPAHPTAAIFESEATAEVRTSDGRTWRVTLEERPTERVESCGAEPVAGFSWQVTDVVQLHA